MKTEIEQIVSKIKNSKKIALAGHISPDADSIGACFAMAYALDKIGKKVWVILDSYSEKYDILPGFDFVVQSDKNIKPDLFIALDCGDEKRLGPALPLFKSTENIVIDHHVNKGFGDYNYIDKDSSSTCEMLFDIIKSLTKLNTNIAKCLYAGIITDTGGFRYKDTTQKTMKIASKLLKYDFDFNDVYETLMYQQTFNQFSGFISIVNDYVYDNKLKFVYTTATEEKMKSLNIDKNDLDGVASFFTRIKDAKLSAFAYEIEKNKTKVSLRSTWYNVNYLAKHFGGGGHRLASAFQIDLSPNEAIEKIKEKLENDLMEQEWNGYFTI